MADAAVSVLLESLIATINEYVKEEISLIKSVKPQLLKDVSFKLVGIQKILQDAEKRSVENEDVKVWLDELKDISYEMDDVLDQWTTWISKRHIPKISLATSLFTSWVSPFKKVGFLHDIGSNIKVIDERLVSVVETMKTFNFDFNQESDSSKLYRITTSIINLSETHGRDFDVKTILSKLLSEGTSSSSSEVPIISVVGVGGLGKTTLAKLVFNNHEVVNSFSKRIWVCVSVPFDVCKIVREIIESIEETKPPNESSLNLLLQHLKRCISNVKFLLVLDDVWDEEGIEWADLRNCLEDGMVGSRVLVTTRKEKVAKVMGTSITNLHRLKELSEEACWSLFSQIAFYDNPEKKDDENLKRIGLEIVKKCKGLPLAVRTLGNVLRSKNTVQEWERVLESEIWKIDKVGVELFPHLYLSYNELPPPIKRCFSYCSIFPKDTEMNVDELIRMWMAQGYVTSTNGKDDMESKGRGYFDKLAANCFFQDFGEDRNGKIYECKMHDIVHEFAQYLTSNEITIIDANEIQKPFPKKTRHANWTKAISRSSDESEEAPLPDDVGNLRSIFIRDYSLQQLGTLISHLKCVRSLVLWRCCLKRLPKEIGSLVHLRLLDLSVNGDLYELPESLCELYNLQTLNIMWCRIKRLPEGIGKLINLRHLLNRWSGLEEYPKSFERLTSLRTLSVFKVGKKYGKLEYLQNLKHLEGSLIIEIDCRDLEVTELVRDAHKSQLINNNYIQDLEFRFVEYEEAEVGESGVHEALLEALLPPRNVTRLTIENFCGRQYPSWLTNNSHFNNLRMLYCVGSNCSTFPPFWKLPYLEELRLERHGNIKHIGRDFLGIEDSTNVNLGNSSLNAATPTTSSSSPALVVFPKLVELSFFDLRGWEEWEDLNEEEYDDEPTNTTSIQLMPRLRELRLWHCTKLEKLPCKLLRKASSLEYLKLKECGISSSNNWQQVEQLVSHIPKIEVNQRVYTPDNPTGTQLD